MDFGRIGRGHDLFHRGFLGKASGAFPGVEAAGQDARVEPLGGEPQRDLFGLVPFAVFVVEHDGPVQGQRRRDVIRQQIVGPVTDRAADLAPAGVASDVDDGGARITERAQVFDRYRLHDPYLPVRGQAATAGAARRSLRPLAIVAAALKAQAVHSTSGSDRATIS